jgi:putative phage-type endonuclease
MTAQLSPLRTGRITGSRVAAIIGKDKYRNREDTMREMVRQHFGADPEFTGNEATRWGNDHEEDARAEYERTTGTLVLDAQDFITHPEFDWLGCSPDGLVGADGMVEFKSPWRARYKTIKDKPEYEAQVQMQLAVTGRTWAHFVIYRVGEPLIVERVDADPDWLPTHLPTLTAFHQEFLETVADETKAAPFLTSPDRSDPEWTEAAQEFIAADLAVDEAGQRLERAKARLKELAGERSAKGCGVSVNRSERAGSVDWKAVAGKYAPDADPDEFRKSSSVVWTIRPTA